MSYRLTRDGQELEISPGVDHDHVYITIGDDNEKCIFAAWHGDAPAVALAILEAAGHPLRTYQPGEMRDLPDVAHDALKRHLTYQEEQAAREAEDLKVADFFTKFDGLTPAFINDHDRRRYRAARKFFEEA